MLICAYQAAVIELPWLMTKREHLWFGWLIDKKKRCHYTSLTKANALSDLFVSLSFSDTTRTPLVHCGAFLGWFHPDTIPIFLVWWPNWMWTSKFLINYGYCDSEWVINFMLGFLTVMGTYFHNFWNLRHYLDNHFYHGGNYDIIRKHVCLKSFCSFGTLVLGTNSDKNIQMKGWQPAPVVCCMMYSLWLGWEREIFNRERWCESAILTRIAL